MDGGGGRCHIYGICAHHGLVCVPSIGSSEGVLGVTGGMQDGSQM